MVTSPANYANEYHWRFEPSVGYVFRIFDGQNVHFVAALKAYMTLYPESEVLGITGL